MINIINNLQTNSNLVINLSPNNKKTKYLSHIVFRKKFKTLSIPI